MERVERKAYLDALRIMSFVFVVYNHVAGQSMRLHEGVGGAVALGMLYISKAAIPLFLMISGATLLNREESYKKTGLRILRIVTVLALTSLFYYGANCLTERAPFVFSEFVDGLYHNQWSNSLWYLYAYIGFLLLLPILQRTVPAFERTEYCYVAFWTLLFTGGMPILMAYSPLFVYDSSFELPLFGGVIGMAMLGRYADTQMRVTRLGTVFAILLPVCMAAAQVAAGRYTAVGFNTFDNALLLPAMVTAFCLFYLVKPAGGRLALPQKARAWISGCGRLVFCAYLLADFVIEKLQFVRVALAAVLSVNPAGVVYTLLVASVSLLVSALLTRIPGLKRLL